MFTKMCARVRLFDFFASLCAPRAFAWQYSAVPIEYGKIAGA